MEYRTCEVGGLDLLRDDVKEVALTYLERMWCRKRRTNAFKKETPRVQDVTEKHDDTHTARDNSIFKVSCTTSQDQIKRKTHLADNYIFLFKNSFSLLSKEIKNGKNSMNLTSTKLLSRQGVRTEGGETL